MLARLAASAMTLVWLGSGVRRVLARRDPTIAPDEVACAVVVWSALALVVSGEVLGALSLLTFPLWVLAAGIVGAALHVVAGRAAAPVADLAPASSVPLTVAFRVTLLGLVLGRAAFLLRNPPTDRDSLCYHLPMIAHWVTSHALGVALWEPPYYAPYYPGNSELLQMWAVLSTGHDLLVAWPGLIALGVAAVALRGLMVDLGASRRVSETLALAFIAAPGVFKLTQGLSVDVFMMAWVAVALRALLRHRRTGQASDLALACAAFGLFSGCRYSAFPFVALAIALELLIPGRGGHRAWPPAIARLALVFPGGFWLARNLAASGNPVFPFQVKLAGLDLPGIAASTALWRTTQIAMWREGYAGHLTLINLWRVLGVAAPALAIGALLWLVRRDPKRAGPTRADAILLAVLALGAFGLFLTSYWSGANLAAEPGRPPQLVAGNLRYLAPAMVALAPIAAAGLSAFSALATLGSILIAALSLAQLRPFLSHLVPGAVLAALLVAWFRSDRRRRLRVPLAAAALIALAFAAPALDLQRARITAQVWEDLSTRDPVLPMATATRALALARGGAIACVGVERPYQLARRDFLQPACYVPLSVSWAEGTRPWHFVLDDRNRPDRERWLENLAASRATVVAILASDSAAVPIERTWCAADSARFRPDLALGRVTLYEVR